MKMVTVAEFKANLSSITEDVKSGQEYVVTRGRKKEKVFKVSPIKKTGKKKREIGILDGKASVEFADDFKMTIEEFLGEWGIC